MLTHWLVQVLLVTQVMPKHDPAVPVTEATTDDMQTENMATASGTPDDARQLPLATVMPPAESMEL